MLIATPFVSVSAQTSVSTDLKALGIRSCADYKDRNPETLKPDTLSIVDQYLQIGYKLADVCQETDGTITALIYRQDVPGCYPTKTPCDTEILFSFRSDRVMTYQVKLKKTINLVAENFADSCFVDRTTAGAAKYAYVVCQNAEGGVMHWYRVTRTNGAVLSVKEYGKKSYITKYPSIFKQFRMQQDLY